MVSRVLTHSGDMRRPMVLETRAQRHGGLSAVTRRIVAAAALVAVLVATGIEAATSPFQCGTCGAMVDVDASGGTFDAQAALGGGQPLRSLRSCWPRIVVEAGRPPRRAYPLDADFTVRFDVVDACPLDLHAALAVRVVPAGWDDRADSPVQPIVELWASGAEATAGACSATEDAARHLVSYTCTVHIPSDLVGSGDGAGCLDDCLRMVVSAVPDLAVARNAIDDHVVLQTATPMSASPARLTVNAVEASPQESRVLAHGGGPLAEDAFVVPGCASVTVSWTAAGFTQGATLELVHYFQPAHASLAASVDELDRLGRNAWQTVDSSSSASAVVGGVGAGEGAVLLASVDPAAGAVTVTLPAPEESSLRLSDKISTSLPEQLVFTSQLGMHVLELRAHAAGAESSATVAALTPRFYVSDADDCGFGRLSDNTDTVIALLVIGGIGVLLLACWCERKRRQAKGRKREAARRKEAVESAKKRALREDRAQQQDGLYSVQSMHQLRRAAGTGDAKADANRAGSDGERGRREIRWSGSTMGLEPVGPTPWRSNSRTSTHSSTGRGESERAAVAAVRAVRASAGALEDTSSDEETKAADIDMPPLPLDNRAGPGAVDNRARVWGGAGVKGAVEPVAPVDNRRVDDRRADRHAERLGSAAARPRKTSWRSTSPGSVGAPATGAGVRLAPITASAGSSAGSASGASSPLANRMAPSPIAARLASSSPSVFPAPARPDNRAAAGSSFRQATPGADGSSLQNYASYGASTMPGTPSEHR